MISKNIQMTHYLNDEQKEVLKRIDNNENIFLTGPPGTGKSHTLRAIVEYTRDRGIGVTAMTGSAAILIQGSTLHSYLGIGLAQLPPERLIKNMQKSRFFDIYFDKLMATNILIIDEVSMLGDKLFEYISTYCSLMRNDSRPFGGIQLVLVGDMYQLPPVEGNYSFTSPEWTRAQIHTISLSQNYRQKDDKNFEQLLGRLRQGDCNIEDLHILKNLQNTVFPDGIVPTRLFPVNRSVDEINEREMNELITKTGVTQISYPTKINDQVYDKMKIESIKHWIKSLNLPQSTLCVGAQVVLTWNIDVDRGLVNGSRGVIIAMDKGSVTVLFACGIREKLKYQKLTHEIDEEMTVLFMPLKLAWAISIHKSQGMTLDAIEIDLGRTIFEYGQAYTGLSRAKNLQSVRIVSVNASSFKTHRLVKQFYKQITK